MKRYFVIKDETVINETLWDGVSPWHPEGAATAELAVESVGIGWRRVAGEWIAPEPPPAPTPDPNKVSARAKLAAIGLTEDEITALVG